ncbi:IclR family transcriptional regulator domain-containing protein [Natronorubrum halophilum]|uniref:IclR family transcriptional regulator domain-containing protein n=1 Tax=Natronorubrum halophilum TaxID=1702106 RepID=UPI0023AB3A15|nr:IclR family transcriptional regulator C-terminal domain-containing protein [Natronorubrum halophilum]
MTPNTVTDRGELDTRLERIQERGVAFDDGERINGFRCVAASIKTEAEVPGAISVSGQKSGSTTRRSERRCRNWCGIPLELSRST